MPSCGCDVRPQPAVWVAVPAGLWLRRRTYRLPACLQEANTRVAVIAECCSAAVVMWWQGRQRAIGWPGRRVGVEVPVVEAVRHPRKSKAVARRSASWCPPFPFLCLSVILCLPFAMAADMHLRRTPLVVCRPRTDRTVAVFSHYCCLSTWMLACVPYVSTCRLCVLLGKPSCAVQSCAVLCASTQQVACAL